MEAPGYVPSVPSPKFGTARRGVSPLHKYVARYINTKRKK